MKSNKSYASTASQPFLKPLTDARIYMAEAMKREEKMIKCEKNMDISEKMLCQANRKDNGQLVTGYYFCMHHNDERKHIHHFIIPLEADLSIGTPIDKIQVEINPNTLTQI